MYEGDEHGHMALQLPDRAVSGYDVFLFEQVIVRAWYVCMYVCMYVMYVFMYVCDSLCM